MPMKEVGAESGDGATMVERHRPEAPDMVAVSQLFLIHEPKGARKGFREGNVSNGKTFDKPFSEEFQHVAAPGKSSSIFRLFAGGEHFSLPFSKVVFDGSAQMFRSERSVMAYAGGVEQGRCQS
jgi:hypothetical protein